jgi:hypothetical protein
MKESYSPMVFWDSCLERRARFHNLTAKSNFKLHGTNSHTVTTGEEGDVYNLCRFVWYDWCYYREHTAAFPKQREVLGRVLGPTRGEGDEMCQWILKANGKVVPRRSVRPLQTAEIHSPSELVKRQVFELRGDMGHRSTRQGPKFNSMNHQRRLTLNIQRRLSLIIMMIKLSMKFQTQKPLWIQRARSSISSHCMIK